MALLKKMSLLNALAFLSLFVLILVQDIIAPPPPFHGPDYPMDRLYRSPSYRRSWRGAEIEEKPTLPPDLLDVPLNAADTTKAPKAGDGSTSTTSNPNELPLDDPIESDDVLVSTTTSTTTTTRKPAELSIGAFPEDVPRNPDKGDADVIHPDSPAESSRSSYNYPIMNGQLEAKYNENSGGIYMDPVLTSKLRLARRRLIDDDSNDGSHDRSDVYSGGIVADDPDFAKDDF